MERDPDLELVRDLGSADAAVRRGALSALYQRHRQRVFNVAYRVLGDWSEAQDVTQEVFVLLADRIGSFRGDASLTSWIYRITVNRAIDARRRWRRRAQPAELDGTAGSATPLGTPRGGTDERAGRSDEAGRVQAALLELSPKLRGVLVLRYLEGLSYEEVAEVLDCSIGTVKSRINRAHAALLRVLGEPPAATGEAIGPVPGH